MYIDDLALALLKRYPWYSGLLRRSRIKIDNNSPHLAGVIVKDSLEIVLNEEKLKLKTEEEQVGTLMHEFDHLAKRHIQQYKQHAHVPLSEKLGKQPSFKTLNWAFDSEINSFNKFIKDSPTSGLARALEIKKLQDQYDTATEEGRKMIDGQLTELYKHGISVFPEFYGERGGDTWQRYYVALLSQQNQKNSQSGGKGDPDEHMHDYFDQSLDNPEIVDGILYKAFKDVENMGYGKTPMEIKKFMGEFEKENTLPWNTIVRQFFQSVISNVRRGIWTKRNRRFPDHMPGYRKEPKVKVMFAMDESGSMSDKQWHECMAEAHVAHRLGIEIWIAQFDTDIANFYKYEGIPGPRLRCGGTSFIPVHKKCLEEGFSALVVFTDGDGAYPPAEEVTYKTLWVIDGSTRPPYGQVIKLPKS